MRQMYPIAEMKHGSKPSAVTVYAKSDTMLATPRGPTNIPWDWPVYLQRSIRDESRILLKAHYYVGQFVTYEPVGRGGAKTKPFKTGKCENWYLTKSEPLEITDLSRIEEGVIEIRCRNLRSKPYADVELEEFFLDVAGRGSVRIQGFPFGYDDITTFYSDQGSERKKVRMHCTRIKGKRNLMYTGATRATEELKIIGITSEADLRAKMELDPKSIVWEAEVEQDLFSMERVAEAREAVRRAQVGILHDDERADGQQMGAAQRAP